MCLWGLISTKEITHVFENETRFAVYFLQINDFLRSTMLAEYHPADLEAISFTLSKKRNMIGS